jgi:hypothetical protein
MKKVKEMCDMYLQSKEEGRILRSENEDILKREIKKLNEQLKSLKSENSTLNILNDAVIV